MWIDVKQNTDEWLNWRLGKIGSSDARVLSGFGIPNFRISNWSDLRLQMVGKAPPPSEEELSNFAHGHKYEPIALERFANWKNSSLPITPGPCWESDIYDCLIASFDGINDYDDYWIEIKCPVSDKSSYFRYCTKHSRQNPAWWQLVHQAIMYEEIVFNSVKPFSDKNYKNRVTKVLNKSHCYLVVYNSEVDMTYVEEFTLRELLTEKEFYLDQWQRFRNGEVQGVHEQLEIMKILNYDYFNSKIIFP